MKQTAPGDDDEALPVIITFTSNHKATLQTTIQMKIFQTFTTLAVLAITFSAAEGRVLRGAAAKAEVDEDMAGVVGRPLTPVSVAGSARRVSRRTARRNSRSLAEEDAIEEDEAGIVGRPLTPVSVAGVARRTARRNSYRKLIADEIAEDEAGVVGRPLTPVSVAGSARRVSRRTARRNSYRKLSDADADEEDFEDQEDATGFFGRGIARVGVRRAAVGAAAIGTAAAVNHHYNKYGYRQLSVDVPAEDEVDEDDAGRIGRPLTPLSVAGVARRSARRTARRNAYYY